MKKFREFLILALFILFVFSSCSHESDVLKSDEKGVKDPSSNLQSDAASQRKNDEKKEESKETSEDRPQVENNGREFIKVKDKIYFRKFLSEERAPISVNGQYRTLFDGVRKSEFGYVTLQDKNFVKVFDDEGYGNIFYFDDKFYLQKEVEDTYVLYSIGIDGNNMEVIGEYDLVQIYEPLGYFILEFKGELQVMKDGQMIKVFKNEERDHYNFNSIIDDKMIITRYTNDENYNSTIRLYSVDLKNFDDMVELGVVKKPDADTDIYLNSSISRVVEKDGRLWVEVTMTQGSARMFVGLSVFSAQPHGENSIKLEKSLVEQDIFEHVPRFDVVNGNVEFCMIPAGDFISDENGIFYNDSDLPTDDAIQYKIYSPADYSNFFDISYRTEVLEKVGDEIYFIVNTNRYYWEVGTRSIYYKLINTEYLCYNTKTKETSYLFDSIPENTDQYAFIWVSKDPNHSGRVLYQMTEYITSEDSPERKQFYGLTDQEFFDLYEIVELVPFANVADLSEDFLFGKNPIYKGEDAKKAFYDVMDQKNAYANFIEEYGAYALPHEVNVQDGLILAKLSFDQYGKKIQYLEFIDYMSNLQ